jgi:hypothetical protein
MRAQERTDREERLLQRTNRQFALLRYEDLLAEGLGRSAIGLRLAARPLTRVHKRRLRLPRPGT